jgi:pyruvate kinase
MQKLTKIIATIGPSSDSAETLKELVKLGVDIIRLNFKHSDTNWHKEKMQMIKDTCPDTATLIDLQGPEIRLKMPFDSIEIKEDEKILLSQSVFETKEKGFSFSDPEIINHISNGQKVLVDDGLFVFNAQIEGDKTFLISHSNGIMANNKSVSVVDLDYDFPTLHDKDKEGLQLAKDEGIDFIALSFVRDAKDIQNLREEMKKIDLNAKIVAKIETYKAIKNIDEIIDVTDAIMVARGDLGVEMPLEQVPFYQKEIIKKCLEKGVPVITATQMLESMTKSSTPTRAEVSDVANAVYDFTDAVMLSGETANGKYPKEAVEFMTKTIKFSEEKNHINDIRNLFDYDLSDNSKMICDSAFNLYKSLKLKGENIKGFISFTETGKTPRMLSRYKVHVPIFAFCPNKDFINKMSLNFGVKPVFQKFLKENCEIVKEDIQTAISHLEEDGECQKGDKLIVLHGDYWSCISGTSTIRLVIV